MRELSQEEAISLAKKAWPKGFPMTRIAGDRCEVGFFRSPELKSEGMPTVMGSERSWLLAFRDANVSPKLIEEFMASLA